MPLYFSFSPCRVPAALLWCSSKCSNPHRGRGGSCPSHEIECREFLTKEGPRSSCCCCLWAVIRVQLCLWPPNRRAQCKLPWTWLEWTVVAEHLPSVFCPVAECLEQADSVPAAVWAWAVLLPHLQWGTAAASCQESSSLPAPYSVVDFLMAWFC